MNDITNLIATDQILVEVTVRLGKTRMTIADISKLQGDDIIILDQDMSDGVEICIGEKVIARGELTASDSAENRLCVRIIGPAPNA